MDLSPGVGEPNQMSFTVGSQLPEYRVKACKSVTDPPNLIHEDEHARRYGYRGGLVPGTSIYAYMSRSLVDFAGSHWLERGWAEVRFVHPIYEGEEVRVAGSISNLDEDGAAWINYFAANPQGVVCAVGQARLPLEQLVSAPVPGDYPAGRRKKPRRITLGSLKPREPLTPVTSDFTRQIQWEYCQKSIRDHHPIYHEFPHPGWLLSQADRILSANYDLPAWMHVASEVQNFHAQREECQVETRGRVREKYEIQGHHFVVLDLALFAAERCLQTIRHTAIFRIAPRAA